MNRRRQSSQGAGFLLRNQSETDTGEHWAGAPPQTPQQPFCIKLLFCGFCCSKVQQKPGRVAGVTATSGVKAEESLDFSSEPEQKKYLDDFS